MNSVDGDAKIILRKIPLPFWIHCIKSVTQLKLELHTSIKFWLISLQKIEGN